MKGNHYGGDSMPNSGGGGGNVKRAKGGSNKGASTGLKKSDEMRADVTASPSNKNPYPDGLA